MNNRNDLSYWWNLIKEPSPNPTQTNGMIDRIDKIFPVKYPFEAFVSALNFSEKTDSRKKQGTIIWLAAKTLRSAGILAIISLSFYLGIGWSLIAAAAVIAWGRDMLKKGFSAAFKTAPSIIPLIFVGFGVVPVFGPFIALAGLMMISAKAITGSVSYVKSLFSASSSSELDTSEPRVSLRTALYNASLGIFFSPSPTSIAPPALDTELQEMLDSNIQQWKDETYQAWLTYFKENTLTPDIIPKTNALIDSLKTPNYVREAIKSLIFEKKDIDTILTSLAHISFENRGLSDASTETTQARKEALTQFWLRIDHALHTLNNERPANSEEIKNNNVVLKMG